MKRKIGTILETDILTEAKERAVRDRRSLADIIQDALISYLHDEAPRKDALRACDKFCSHGSALERQEIDELLQEEMFVV